MIGCAFTEKHWSIGLKAIKYDDLEYSEELWPSRLWSICVSTNVLESFPLYVLCVLLPPLDSAQLYDARKGTIGDEMKGTSNKLKADR